MPIVLFVLVSIFAGSNALAKGPDHCNWHNENQYWCYPRHVDTEIDYQDYYLGITMGSEAYTYVLDYLVQRSYGSSVNTNILYEDWVLRTLNNGLVDSYQNKWDEIYQIFMHPKVRISMQQDMFNPTIQHLGRKPYSNNLENNVSIWADQFQMEKFSICMLGRLRAFKPPLFGSFVNYWPHDWCNGARVEYHN